MRFVHSLAALFIVPTVLAQASPFEGVYSPSLVREYHEDAKRDVSSSSTTSTSSAASSSSTGDAQSSLTLLNSVIATGFANDGQAGNATEGQVASLTSTNNFINFCATVNKPITNGQQIASGSCNPAPMGVIASSSNMPSAKFLSPKNGDSLPANQNISVQLAVNHLNTGYFTNSDSTFLAAPQQVDSSGDITGHSHIVIESLSALDQTSPTDPSQFVYFKALNDPAQDGVLSAVVPNGLPDGFYRIASIHTAANHQPPLVAVAQHGALDDMVYFTVTSTADASTSSNGASHTYRGDMPSLLPVILLGIVCYWATDNTV